MMIENSPIEQNKSKRIEKYLIIAIGVAALIVVGLLIGTIFSSQNNSAFQSETQSLVRETEKLRTMTTQGVNYNDYRNQLVNVKTEFNLIGQWPKKYSGAENEFNEALKVSDVVLDVWSAGIEYDYDFYLYIDKDPVYKYTGIYEIGGHSYGDIVSELLSVADGHFKKAKSILGYK